jgi:ankyrin repeat protein
MWGPEPRREIRAPAKARRPHEESQAEGLYGAVLRGDLDAVRRLVEEGVDVNQDIGDGVTPLHAAASSESEHALEIVKILLAHGADVNAKVKSDDPADGRMHIDEGFTPLHHAVGVQMFDEDLEIRSNKAVVELLLNHGAKVNEKDAYGYTPLFATVFPGSPDVMELLIEHGADVNVKNGEDGGTVLHEAVYYGPLDIIAMLIAHGANVSARDFYGETPLHRAALGRYQDVVDYLVKHGADLHARSKRDETPQDFLDESNDPEPILLPDSTERVFSLIITDGLMIRQMLKSRSIDYDRLWFPAASDIDGLRAALRKWLTDEAPRIKAVNLDEDYILRHFDRYDREYAGFVKDGARHILCNMVQFPPEYAAQPPRSRFFGMFDGGCAWFVVVFEARTRQVVWYRCNNL